MDVRCAGVSHVWFSVPDLNRSVEALVRRVVRMAGSHDRRGADSGFTVVGTLRTTPDTRHWPNGSGLRCAPSSASFRRESPSSGDRLS